MVLYAVDLGDGIQNFLIVNFYKVKCILTNTIQNVQTKYRFLFDGMFDMHWYAM